MMSVAGRRIAGIMVIAGGLAAPAAGGAEAARPAVTAAPFARCYAAPHGTVPPISVSLSGGGGGDGYVLSATYPHTRAGNGDAGSTDGTFDASGNATAVLSGVAPYDDDRLYPTPGSPVALDVKDYTPTQGPVSTPIGNIIVSQEGVDVAVSPTDPRKPRFVTAADIAWAGKPIYGFVTNRAGTKLLRRFAIGRGNACGYAKRKALASPPGSRAGRYVLWVGAGSRLSKSSDLKDPFSITAG
jgi:hypothetical protein